MSEFQTYSELSRERWGVTPVSRNPTVDELKAGALVRIASALELLNERGTELEQERKKRKAAERKLRGLSK